MVGTLAGRYGCARWRKEGKSKREKVENEKMIYNAYSELLRMLVSIHVQKRKIHVGLDIF